MSTFKRARTAATTGGGSQAFSKEHETRLPASTPVGRGRGEVALNVNHLGRTG
jgi:hypothetical protein